jgi:hypothetical protein
MGIAWLVGTIVALASFLLGWGLVVQLYRNMGVDVALVPLNFWVILSGVCLGLAVALSYRHTAAWLKACRGSDATDGAENEKPAPLRASFSLGTLFLYQLILLLGVGLWIECRRDWVLEQYREQARVADHARWVQSLEVRFGGNNWTIRHSELDDPERGLELDRIKGLNIEDNDETVLNGIRADDGLKTLVLRSRSFSDASLKKLTRIKSIQLLYIASPELTDAGIVELRNFPNLQRLVLRSPKLTNHAIDLLDGIDAQIWIESPLVTQAAVEAHNGKQHGNWVSLIQSASE